MNELKAGQPFQPSMLLEGILVPEALLKDPTLSSSARLLWGILADYQGTSSECFPLEETLAVFLSVQVRQLQTYLKELANYTRGDPPEAVPLLAVKRVWVEKDQKTRNCYTLLWQPFLGVDLKEAGTKRTHRANGGNAQSVAHRSGENTQNMHPVPPGIPGEDDGVVGAGMSRSDRQSSARRSVDDLQDPASGWPAIPREDGCAVPDGRPPGDTQYSAHQSGSHPQDTTPKRPGIPRDDDRTVADGRPPGDTQSLAHRSQGDPQDTGRPAIPGEDEGTIPHAMQPGDASARVVNTQSRELSRPLTQPLAPVLRPICGATARPGGMHAPLVYGEVQDLRRHGEPHSHFDGQDERCILREMLPCATLWGLKPSVHRQRLQESVLMRLSNLDRID